MSEWHSQSTAEVLSALKSDRKRGLTAAAAEERLGQYGRNELEQGSGKSLVRRLLEQLKDPMILVLLAAAGLSL